MSNTASDKLLKAVIKLQRGYHSSAFKFVYDTLSPKLYFVCLRYLHDTDDANDALQEVFIIVYKKIASYKGEGSFEGWAKRITANYCLLVIKRRKIKIELNEDNAGYIEQDSGDELFELEGLKDKLEAALLNLPDGFRTIINLFVFEEYSHKEIAEMLQISEGTSRSQLSRAKIALKKQMLIP
jgi:RNA polymerase sigma-70 factor (ECF subfamily)